MQPALLARRAPRRLAAAAPGATSIRYVRGSKRSRSCCSAGALGLVQLHFLHRQRGLPPHHLHRLVQALPQHRRAQNVVALDHRSAAPATIASSTLATGKAQLNLQQIRIALLHRTGGGTGSLPAAAPADRCPGCCSSRPAPAARCRSISCLAQIHQRQHLRRDRFAARRDQVRRHLNRIAAAASRLPPAAASVGAREQRAHVRLQPQPPHPLDQPAPPAASGRRARRSCRGGRPARPPAAPARSPPAPARPPLPAPRTRRAHTHHPPAPAAPLRSSFPFGVSGNAASCTYAAGTMYSGSACCTCSRSACASTTPATPSASV